MMKSRNYFVIKMWKPKVQVIY